MRERDKGWRVCAYNVHVYTIKRYLKAGIIRATLI